MAARIQHHRDGRPAHWRTAERWQHLDELITAANDPQEAILLECITTMVTNLLFALGGDSDPDSWDYAAMEQSIEDEIRSLIAACQRCPAGLCWSLTKSEWGLFRRTVWHGIFAILQDV